MSTPNCSNFCTIEQCQELAQRIVILEQALKDLELAFYSHVLHDIPEAHRMPPIQVEADIYNDEIIFDVTVGDRNDFATVELPRLPVTIDTFETEDDVLLVVQVGEERAETTLPIPNLPVALDTFETSNGTALVVQVGEERGETILPVPNLPVAIDASLENGNTVLTVQVGEEQDRTILPTVSTQEEEINVAVNYFDDGTLIVYVAYGESFDRDEVDIGRRTTNSPGGGGGGNNSDMSCENLSQEFQDCCAQILAAVGLNLQKIQELEQYVTVDVSSTVYSDYSCEFPTDDSDQPLLTYAEASSVKKNFEGRGIQGLNQRLIYLAKNQDAIYAEICKAIDPIRNVTRQDLYQFCGYGGVDRSDFDNTPEGTELYEAAVEAYVAELINQSKYGYLFDGDSSNLASDDVLLSAPASYINEIKSDFALIQARDNNKALCNAGDAPDVVAIVASDKVLDKHQGKTLILHLVTFENYPKRLPGSSYWQQQIPEPKPSYVWEDDFKSLSWNRGNLYSELYFEGIKDPVSGWFLNEDAADSWFDEVLKLTTAIERARKYHKRKIPARNIANNTVRPYRAFITSVSDTGQAICEVKYVPPIKDE